jgi:hypothetical protein
MKLFGMTVENTVYGYSQHFQKNLFGRRQQTVGMRLQRSLLRSCAYVRDSRLFRYSRGRVKVRKQNNKGGDQSRGRLGIFGGLWTRLGLMSVRRLTSPNAEQQAPFRACQTEVTKHFHVPDPIASAKSENQGKSAVGFQRCQRSCVQCKRADTRLPPLSQGGT